MQENINLQRTRGVLWSLIPPGLLVPLDSFTSVEKRVEKKISSQFISNLLIKCAEMKEEFFFFVSNANSNIPFSCSVT